MILRRIAVKRLGRFREAQFGFSHGLNVVIGPNEAGKTTLCLALVLGLFVKPTTRASKWLGFASWSDLQPFWVELELEDDKGGNYLLTKDFGRGLSQLICPDGKRTVESDDVHRRLAELTGLDSEEIFRSTIYVDQAELEKIQARRVGDALEGLVSGAPDDSRAMAVLERLDAAVRRLEQGLDRPSRNLGDLARAQQEVSRLEDELKRAREWGRELDEIGGQLSAIDAKLDTVTARRRRLQRLSDTLESHLAKVQELERSSKELESLRDRVVQALNVTQELGRLRAELKRLSEWEGAEVDLKLARELDQTLAEMRARAAELTGRVHERDHLRGGSEDLANARSISEEIERLDRSAWWPIGRSLAVLGILGAAFLGFLGAALLGSVGGWSTVVLLLLLAGLGLEVLDLARQWSRHRQLWRLAAAQRERLETILRRRHVGSVAELELKLAALEELERQLESVKSRVKATEARLVEVLRPRGVTTIAQLEAGVGRRREVIGELAVLEARLEGILGGRSVEELQSMYLELSAQVNNLREEIKRNTHANPLDTEGYGKVKERLLRLKTLEAELSEQKARLHGRLEVLEKQWPGPVEELEDELEMSKNHLRYLEQRRNVYSLLREYIANARQTVLLSARDLLKTGIQTYLARLTGDRYALVDVRLEDNRLIVEVFSRDKGDYVQAEEGPLSRGTVDQIFFAARLALSELVCGAERRPFLIIDDAFCTYDDERLALAASLVRELARDRQVIVLTCQARCAELLAEGSHIIRLPAPE